MPPYHDAQHFDQLQDERAEQSIGTGEPITLAQLFRSKTSPVPAMMASPPPAGERQAPVPADDKAVPPPGDRGNGACPTCGGDGEVLSGASIHSTGPVAIVRCPDCSGTGEHRNTEE